MDSAKEDKKFNVYNIIKFMKKISLLKTVTFREKFGTIGKKDRGLN